MKRHSPITCVLLIVLLWPLVQGCATRPHPHPATLSSFDVTGTRGGQRDIAVGMINFKNADVAQVLTIYQEVSRRTVIRPATLPPVSISVRNQTPLSKVELLQLLDTVLAENGIAMVLAGDAAVKAVPAVQAAQASPPEISLPWQSLPESGSYMMRTIQLKRLRPSELVQVLMPLSKTPNAILPIDSQKQIILRDYSSNIRKMLRLVEDLEKNASK